MLGRTLRVTVGDERNVFDGAFRIMNLTTRSIAAGVIFLSGLILFIMISSASVELAVIIDVSLDLAKAAISGLSHLT